MYTTPCTSAGKKRAPLVKIGNREYAIVDPTRREEHTYANTFDWKKWLFSATYMYAF